jgi:hypothetical protein
MSFLSIRLLASAQGNEMELYAFRPWMVASAGETDRDLAWTQLAQKLDVYNII